MRNTTTNNREPLKSIGGITPERVLKEAFDIVSTRDLTRFDHKTIVDVGAGFSDLLNHISKHSKPGRLIAVDPIYGGDEDSASRYTIDSIQVFIDELLKNPNAKNDEIIMQMYHNAEGQKRTISEYHEQFDGIERYKNIPDSIDADCVFMINVLFGVADPHQILSKADQELNDDGEIVIIDYVWRGNQIDQRLRRAGIAIRDFDQYFVARLHKGDVERIDSSIYFIK